MSAKEKGESRRGEPPGHTADGAPVSRQGMRGGVGLTSLRQRHCWEQVLPCPTGTSGAKISHRGGPWWAEWARPQCPHVPEALSRGGVGRARLGLRPCGRP